MATSTLIRFLLSLFPISGDDLMRCVDLYNQSQSKWFEEMVTTSLVRDQAFGSHQVYDNIVQSFAIALAHFCSNVQNS